MKKLICIAMLAVGALLLTACSAREPITAEEFVARMEGAGHSVVDATYDYDIPGMVRLMVGYAYEFYVEFIVWETDEQARTQFQAVRRIFENNRANTVSYRSTDTARVNRLTQTTGGRFDAVVRIENTLLVINTGSNLRTEAQGILELLGY